MTHAATYADRNALPGLSLLGVVVLPIIIQVAVPGAA